MRTFVEGYPGQVGSGRGLPMDSPEKGSMQEAGAGLPPPLRPGQWSREGMGNLQVIHTDTAHRQPLLLGPRLTGGV